MPSLRESIWQQAFGQSLVTGVLDGQSDWLAHGATTFARLVLEHCASGAVDEDLIDDLGRIVTARDDSSDLRTVMDQGLLVLVQICCVLPDQRSPAGTIARQESAIRAARAILLRVTQPMPSVKLGVGQFPVWVQSSLLSHTLDAIEADAVAFTAGTSVRAKSMALMLAANVAAIQSPECKARFAGLLAILCERSEDYDDPFLRDRLLIMQRVLDL